MRFDAFGSHTYRAFTLEAAVRAELGGWMPWFRPQALYGLSLAVAIAGPELPLASQLALTKLGAWICAFDDLIDRGMLDDDEIDVRIAQYEALAAGGCAEVAYDPIARVCGEVLDALGRAPLGNALWPQVSAQLAGTCRAMLAERQLLAHHRAGHAVSAEQYLEHAVDSIAVSLATTAATILIGEPGILDHREALVRAQRHAAAAIRLANDLATAPRELAEGASANVLTFSTGGRDALEAQIEHEVWSCAAVTATFAAAAPVTAAFLTRFTDFLVATYRRGDL